jgi:hypothetical protein
LMQPEPGGCFEMNENRGAPVGPMRRYPSGGLPPG